jgi:hypothetical protein
MGGKGSGTSSDARSRHELCGATKKNGEKCRKYAGEGTEHLGVGRCKYHLGNTKEHKIHAVKVTAQKEAAKAQQTLLEQAVNFGVILDIEPVEALLMTLRMSYGHLSWLRFEITQLKDKASFDARVLLRMFDDERERVARIAKMALDAGVQERQVRLAERYGEMLANLLMTIFGDPELALTTKQERVLPGLLRRHLVVVDDQLPPNRQLLPASPAARPAGRKAR